MKNLILLSTIFAFAAKNEQSSVNTEIHQHSIGFGIKSNNNMRINMTAGLGGSYSCGRLEKRASMKEAYAQISEQTQKGQKITEFRDRKSFDIPEVNNFKPDYSIIVELSKDYDNKFVGITYAMTGEKTLSFDETEYVHGSVDFKSAKLDKKSFKDVAQNKNTRTSHTYGPRNQLYYPHLQDKRVDANFANFEKAVQTPHAAYTFITSAEHFIGVHFGYHFKNQICASIALGNTVSELKLKETFRPITTNRFTSIAKVSYTINEAVAVSIFAKYQANNTVTGTEFKPLGKMHLKQGHEFTFGLGITARLA